MYKRHILTKYNIKQTYTNDNKGLSGGNMLEITFRDPENREEPALLGALVDTPIFFTELEDGLVGYGVEAAVMLLNRFIDEEILVDIILEPPAKRTGSPSLTITASNTTRGKERVIIF